MLIKQKPKIYDRLKQQFDIDWDVGIIIAYYPDIYCKFDLDELKICHEETHLRQQEAYGVEAWWERYLDDVRFRLLQEVEAYKNEANLARKYIRDRNKLARYIDQIAKDLSSSIYGNIVSYGEAMKLLK